MEYAERDIEDLGDYYTRHVNAMTGESLNMKSQIAAELAHRDKTISELTAMVEWLRKTLHRLTIGSCTCCTKSPMAEYHGEGCNYRVAVEALEQTPPQALNAIRAEVAEKCAKLVEERGESVGGAIDPKITASAIRNMARKYEVEE